MGLVSETLEDPKGRLEAWKGASESKGLRVNVEKTKMKIIGENVGKVTIEGWFPCAVYRKSVASNSILCQFYRCLLLQRCNGVRGKLEKEGQFKCQGCANQ